MTRNGRIPQKRPQAQGNNRWVCKRGVLALLASASLFVGTTATAAASTVHALRASTSTAQAKITADRVTFFAGSTPAARKIALLQDGKTFDKVIEAQASSPISKSVAAKVNGVTLTSSTEANGRYSLTLGGQPALTNVQGQAIRIGGTWKVGEGSFCGLLALEQEKFPACSARVNRSSGNTGVLRVFPLALFFDYVSFQALASRA